MAMLALSVGGDLAWLEAHLQRALFVLSTELRALPGCEGQRVEVREGSLDGFLVAYA
jgi:hypothetical protein